MGAAGQKTIGPAWLPVEVQRYLLHTERGCSLRELARLHNCHPSTIMRQVRKLETLRDDPLIDEALDALSRAVATAPGQKRTEEKCNMTSQMPDDTELNNESIRVLRRLCENGAVLAVAGDMEKAVVVREDGDAATRTAVIDRSVAQAMVLKEWIVCPEPGRVSRYHVTAAGRAALNKMLADNENKALGFAECQVAFAGQNTNDATVANKGRPMRFSIAESPLTALARRRDKSGMPFLAEDMVAAGEQLREDFELAQMGPRTTKHWQQFLAGDDPSSYVTDPGVTGAPAMARERVVQAMRELGEGLSDVALRCCCFLEGLETAEKRLGWSARSGKIVLRIALLRLSDYYRSQAGGAGRMIG